MTAQPLSVAENEIISSLNSLSNDDPEISHGVADELLIEALQLAGKHDIVTAYEAARDRIGFWYA